MNTGRVIVALSIVCAALMFGCSGGSADDATAIAQPEVDPRFESAEALVAHYNSLTTRTPVDAVSALDLFYPENNIQRQYLNVSRSMLAMAEFDQAMFEKFGEGFDPKERRPLLSPDQPASIIQRDGARAQARFIDHDGDEQTLQLVQLDGRWWISGYTLEYNKSLTDAIGDLDRFERSTKAWAEGIRPVIVRLRNGEFSSAPEARKAAGQALAAAVPFPTRN